MTHLQLTPEGPPEEIPEGPPQDAPASPPQVAPQDPDAPRAMHAPGEESPLGADQGRDAEAARLQRYEVERAADEGMTEPPAEAAAAEAEAGLSPEGVEPMSNPAFEEGP